MLSSSQKHNMEPKYVIGLSLQGSLLNILRIIYCHSEKNYALELETLFLQVNAVLHQYVPLQIF